MSAQASQIMGQYLSRLKGLNRTLIQFSPESLYLILLIAVMDVTTESGLGVCFHVRREPRRGGLTDLFS